jgi:sugar lactone lactonase YvrE
MFVGGRQGDDITQYDLSTAWDVSTASGAGTFSVAAKEANPFGFAFNNDGTTFYVTGSNGAIQEYNVQSAAYSVVNGQFVRTKYINGSGQTSNPTGLAFKDDGTKVYSIGNTNDRVAQFSTGSTAAATFTYPSSVKFPNGTAPAGPAIGETDVLVFYTDDGGTTYQGFRAGNEMS